MAYFVTMLLALLLINNMSFGQHLTFPDGVFFSHESLLAGVPDRTDTLKVIRRSDGDIIWAGGNPYRLDSDRNDFNWRQIHKQVLAYVQNDSIFLNGTLLGVEALFSLALTKGMYLVFYNAESKNSGSVAAAAVLGGAIGGAIAAAVTHKKGDQGGTLYVLSLRTGNTKRLGPVYTTARLEENSPELLAEFKKEPHPDSDLTLIDYINRLNRVLDK